MKAACILFDLDGTILNTNNLILETLQHTIKTHMGIRVADEKLYKYFGQPLVRIMADLDPDRAEEMVLTYRNYNALRHDDLVELFPRVCETLAQLNKENIAAGVVTSKARNFARRGLELFGLENSFDVFIAFEDTEKHKPEPDPILKALEGLNLKAGGSDIIMVGDSPYDITCAKNAGVLSAAVGWSLHPRDVLESCKPDLWLNDFADLLNYV
ncbi:MAG: pyrophosphatase PpaX [Firmicutes bacterium HGW-Firmicutes-14]|nr:MAG: pyrophosphatase PpaX [Firmicutes bacterium HGW-Firmicutes-14]